MSQPYQQPNQPQQPGGFGAPQPGGFPQQGGFPPPPPAGGRNGNVALAILAAVGITLIAAFAYAYLFKSGLDEETGEVTQYTYAAVVVGALIGAAIGKLGGNNVALWVVGAVLALFAIIAGEIYGMGLIAEDVLGGSATDFIFEDFGETLKGWSDGMEFLNWIFLALGPVAAFFTARKLAD